ncbi:MAG: COG4315 family predicted lipoprotein, partial [Acidimicrobiales bacterium]
MREHRTSRPESRSGARLSRSGARLDLKQASAARKLTRPALIGAAVVAGGLAAAACGSATGATSTTSAAARPTSSTKAPAGATPSAAAVHTAKVAGVGTVLVTSTGRTLYLFSPDKQKMVTCTASSGCAKYWPPLELGAGVSVAHPGLGLEAPLLGTIEAPDGHSQVTYDRWPLYTFAGDSGPGQAKGQGLDTFGGHWAAVTAAGRAAGSGVPPASSTPSTAAT